MNEDLVGRVFGWAGLLPKVKDGAAASFRMIVVGVLMRTDLISIESQQGESL